MIPINIRLITGCNGFPYALGKPDKIDGLVCYWRQVQIDCAHSSIWIGTDEDINVTKVRLFNGYLLRSIGTELEFLVTLMKINPILLINGNIISGYMALKDHQWLVPDEKWSF